MQKVIEKVFIGLDIDRTSSLIIGGASDNLAEGEIVVLDKNKSIMTAGAVFSDTDSIYIVEGLSTTYDYVNEAGTSVTDVREYLISDKIDGRGVSEYSGKAYSAPAEMVYSIDLTGWTPVVGTEYIFKIVYKDIEGSRQFSKTYHYIASSVTLDTEGAAIAALINADVNRRVDVTYTAGTDILAFTGRSYGDNETVNSINEYGQVIFEVFLFSDNFNTLTTDPYRYVSTDPSQGSGQWRLVRDEEKWSQGYEGQTNRTQFPVIGPDFRTVKSETYDTLIIRHKNWFTSADGREEQVDITTKVFIPNTATSNQMTDVLAVLNPWMASLPKSFDSVSF
jgi:hypothetical protein